MSESPILAAQGYQALMYFTRNSIIQALMRPFVIVEGEVALEPGLQIFADEWLTAALLDRLKHHAHIVEFTGADSYRFRQWLQREG